MAESKKRCFHITYNANTSQGMGWGDCDYFSDSGMTSKNLDNAREMIAAKTLNIIGKPVILYWQEYEEG